MLRRVRPSRFDRRATTRAAGAGLALAVGLTACSGSGSDQERAAEQAPSKALQAVRAAYEKTTSAESVQVALTGEQTGKSQGGKSSTVTGSAKLSFADRASQRAIDAPGSEPTSRSREIDGILYQKVPEKQRKQVPGNKPWIKIDLGKLGKAFGQPADEQPPTDPANILGYLRGVTKARSAGTPTIDGTDTTRYQITVNLGKIAKDKNSPAAERAKQLMQQLGKNTMPMQVWLDEQNRVRRLRTEVSSGGRGPAKQAQSTTVVTTEDFHSYNESINISPPPKSDTADVTERVIKRQKQQMQMQQQMQKLRRQKMQQQLKQRMQQQQKRQQQQKQGQSGQK